LIYLINRYYDPATDEFLSIDPDVATTNQPYVFTNDDALNAVDPLGTDAVRIGEEGAENAADYCHAHQRSCDKDSPSALQMGLALTTVLPVGDLAGALFDALRGGGEAADGIDDAMGHILDEHGPGTELNGKGTFSEGTSPQDIQSMINDTRANGFPRANTLGRPGQIFENTYSSPIGTNGAGVASSSLRVVVDGNGK
jgi:hypothetical protein